MIKHTRERLRRKIKIKMVAREWHRSRRIRRREPSTRGNEETARARTKRARLRLRLPARRSSERANTGRGTPHRHRARARARRHADHRGDSALRQRFSARRLLRARRGARERAEEGPPGPRELEGDSRRRRGGVWRDAAEGRRPSRAVTRECARSILRESRYRKNSRWRERRSRRRCRRHSPI